MSSLAQDVLSKLWRDAGGPEHALESIAITGEDPALPSTFRVGTAAAATIGAAALAAAEIHKARTDHGQQVTLDYRRAAAAFRSERYLRVDNGPAPDLWSPIAGFYEAGDGRWIQLHTNFPHHRDRVLARLNCPEDRDAVAHAIRQWKAQDLETALADDATCAAMVRSPEEWAAHLQGKAVAGLPLIEIERIGDAPPEPLPPSTRPLTGLRVLDLTRVIAGPVCGRTLAEHGATVMRVASPNLPYIKPLVIDGGRGKLSSHIDLEQPEETHKLLALVSEADVFIQGYRPGALAARGLSPETLAAHRPGLVYVSLSAYGHVGPWSGRRGYDSLVQSASGIAWREAEAAGSTKPRHLPAQALDHGSGYLMAFGAMMALLRRQTDGGSWLVRVSLAQTGHWLKGLGRVEGIDHPDVKREDVTDLLQEADSPFGHTSFVGPAAEMSLTPPHWVRPAVPLGTDAPAWPTT